MLQLYHLYCYAFISVCVCAHVGCAKRLVFLVAGNEILREWGRVEWELWMELLRFSRWWKCMWVFVLIAAHSWNVEAIPGRWPLSHSSFSSSTSIQLLYYYHYSLILNKLTIRNCCHDIINSQIFNIFNIFWLIFLIWKEIVSLAAPGAQKLFVLLRQNWLSHGLALLTAVNYILFIVFYEFQIFIGTINS